MTTTLMVRHRDCSSICIEFNLIFFFNCWNIQKRIFTQSCCCSIFFSYQRCLQFFNPCSISPWQFQLNHQIPYLAGLYTIHFSDVQKPCLIPPHLSQNFMRYRLILLENLWYIFYRNAHALPWIGDVSNTQGQAYSYTEILVLTK